MTTGSRAVKRAILLFLGTATGAVLALSAASRSPVVRPAAPSEPRGVSFLGREDVILQQSQNDCGLAALAMLGRAIGTPIDLAELRRTVSVGRTGLTMLSLREIADAYGVTTEGVYADPLEGPELPTPWIAHLRTGVGHYVVVERYEGLQWTVADPTRGRVQYSEAAFRRVWSGYALVASVKK